MTREMKIAHTSRSRAGSRASVLLLCAAACVAASLALPGAARAQVAPAADEGGLILYAGATGTGEMVQYGQRKMLGVTAFVDADTHRRLGLEFEGRWLEFHQTANVHVETYSAGLRYHFNVGRWQPYAKGLVGFGNFNFPYNLATGQYLVITAGGGVDYHATRRICFRVADFEYQDWPEFTFGNMSNPSVSAGLRVRIF